MPPTSKSRSTMWRGYMLHQQCHCRRLSVTSTCCPSPDDHSSSRTSRSGDRNDLPLCFTCVSPVHLQTMVYITCRSCGASRGTVPQGTPQGRARLGQGSQVSRKSRSSEDKELTCGVCYYIRPLLYIGLSDRYAHPFVLTECPCIAS